MAHPTLQYLTREYLERNPTWDLEYTPLKASIVAGVLANNGIHPASICEVGCGSGGCLAELRTIYPEVALSGYDIAPTAASFWTQYDGLNIHFEVGDVLQKTSLKCEVLLMLDVIEHLPDPTAFFPRCMERQIITCSIFRLTYQRRVSLEKPLCSMCETR